MSVITLPQLTEILGSERRAEAWHEPLCQAAFDGELDAPYRVSMFLATICFESGGLVHLVENLNYSAEAILRVWPSRFSPEQAKAYAHQPERLASFVYAKRNGNGNEASGDGWRYRGRGPIQLTGRGNYLRAGEALGLDLVGYPAQLEEPLPGARMSAWFWRHAGCNRYADAGNFAATQGLVNRGSPQAIAHDMTARFAWHQKVAAALA